MTFCFLQDYFIRHENGCTLDTDAEDHLKVCLEAAINRRTTEVQILPNV
jgi:hypothetical protein